MASSSKTLYTGTATTEAFSMRAPDGKSLIYDGASGTATLPHQLVITTDRKAIGNMSNDRMSASVKFAGAKTATSQIGISSTTITTSVAKDATSGATLVADAVASVLAAISYFTGSAPDATTVANVTNWCNGLAL